MNPAQDLIGDSSNFPETLPIPLDGAISSPRMCSDYSEVTSTEILYNPKTGQVWVNIDGICALRVRKTLFLVSEGI